MDTRHIQSNAYKVGLQCTDNDGGKYKMTVEVKVLSRTKILWKNEGLSADPYKLCEAARRPSAEASSRSRDVTLALTIGHYVNESVPCNNKQSAYSMDFDGKALNSAHAEMVSILGKEIRPKQFMVDARFHGTGGVGGAEYWNVKQFISIMSRSRFAIATEATPKASTYRLCH